MLEKPNKLRVCLISGAAIGVVSAVPGLNLINCCCCAGVILGGVLAVFLYKQEFVEGMPPLESSDAVILGIISGLVAAFVSTTLDLMILAAFGNVGDQLMRSLFEGALKRLEEQGQIPPEIGERFQEELEKSSREAGRAVTILSGLVVSLIIDPLFAMLGALIGYSVFKPKKPLEQQPQPQIPA